MSELEVIVQPSVDPALAPAVDAWLMRDIADGPRGRAALRVYTFARDAVSLGRYHFAPRERPSAPALARRHAGGRAWPQGDGFVALSLVLRHRSALVSDDPFALAPHQVPNRCVRPILDGCRLAGLEPFYPGRDLITVGGRVLGALSFEVDGRGTLLFEAVLSAGRTFAALGSLLDVADPGGEVVARLWSAEETTSLEREGRSGLGVEDVADLVCRAFEEKLQASVRQRTVGESDWQEIRALAGAEYDPARWLHGRGSARGLRFAAAVQLGVLECRLARGTEGEVEHVVFGGDFIANSPAIESLEHRLRSCRIDRASIARVVEEVFADPGNFALGIGKVSAITDLVLQAAEK